MLALFTGLRDSNATTLREEIIDWKRGGFVIPMSKTTPFTIPFGPTVPMHAQPRVENQRSLWRRVRGSAHGDRGSDRDRKRRHHQGQQHDTWSTPVGQVELAGLAQSPLKQLGDLALGGSSAATPRSNASCTERP